MIFCRPFYPIAQFYKFSTILVTYIKITSCIYTGKRSIFQIWIQSQIFLSIKFASITVLKEVKYSRRDKMNVIFCRPELTMEDVGDAICFFNECHTILDKYIYNLRTMSLYLLWITSPTYFANALLSIVFLFPTFRWL